MDNVLKAEILNIKDAIFLKELSIKLKRNETVDSLEIEKVLEIIRDNF